MEHAEIACESIAKEDNKMATDNLACDTNELRIDIGIEELDRLWQIVIQAQEQVDSFADENEELSEVVQDTICELSELLVFLKEAKSVALSSFENKDDHLQHLRQLLCCLNQSVRCQLMELEELRTATGHEKSTFKLSFESSDHQLSLSASSAGEPTLSTSTDAAVDVLKEECSIDNRDRSHVVDASSSLPKGEADTSDCEVTEKENKEQMVSELTASLFDAAEKSLEYQYQLKLAEMHYLDAEASWRKKEENYNNQLRHLLNRLQQFEQHQSTPPGPVESAPECIETTSNKRIEDAESRLNNGQEHIRHTEELQRRVHELEFELSQVYVKYDMEREALIEQYESALEAKHVVYNQQVERCSVLSQELNEVRVELSKRDAEIQRFGLSDETISIGRITNSSSADHHDISAVNDMSSNRSMFSEDSFIRKRKHLDSADFQFDQSTTLSGHELDNSMRKDSVQDLIRVPSESADGSTRSGSTDFQDLNQGEPTEDFVISIPISAATAERNGEKQQNDDEIEEAENNNGNISNDGSMNPVSAVLNEMWKMEHTIRLLRTHCELKDRFIFNSKNSYFTASDMDTELQVSRESVHVLQMLLQDTQQELSYLSQVLYSRDDSIADLTHQLETMTSEIEELRSQLESSGELIDFLQAEYRAKVDENLHLSDGQLTGPVEDAVAENICNSEELQRPKEAVQHKSVHESVQSEPQSKESMTSFSSNAEETAVEHGNDLSSELSQSQSHVAREHVMERLASFELSLEESQQRIETELESELRREMKRNSRQGRHEKELMNKERQLRKRQEQVDALEVVFTSKETRLLEMKSELLLKRDDILALRENLVSTLNEVAQMEELLAEKENEWQEYMVTTREREAEQCRIVAGKDETIRALQMQVVDLSAENEQTHLNRIHLESTIDKLETDLTTKNREIDELNQVVNSQRKENDMMVELNRQLEKSLSVVQEENELKFSQMKNDHVVVIEQNKQAQVVIMQLQNDNATLKALLCEQEQQMAEKVFTIQALTKDVDQQETLLRELEKQLGERMQRLNGLEHVLSYKEEVIGQKEEMIRFLLKQSEEHSSQIQQLKIEVKKHDEKMRYAKELKKKVESNKKQFIVLEQQLVELMSRLEQQTSRHQISTHSDSQELQKLREQLSRTDDMVHQLNSENESLKIQLTNRQLLLNQCEELLSQLNLETEKREKQFAELEGLVHSITESRLIQQAELKNANLGTQLHEKERRIIELQQVINSGQIRSLNPQSELATADQIDSESVPMSFLTSKVNLLQDELALKSTQVERLESMVSILAKLASIKTKEEDEANAATKGKTKHDPTQTPEAKTGQAHLNSIMPESGIDTPAAQQANTHHTTVGLADDLLEKYKLLAEGTTTPLVSRVLESHKPSPSSLRQHLSLFIEQQTQMLEKVQADIDSARYELEYLNSINEDSVQGRTCSPCTPGYGSWSLMQTPSVSNTSYLVSEGTMSPQTGTANIPDEIDICTPPSAVHTKSRKCFDSNFLSPVADKENQLSSSMSSPSSVISLGSSGYGDMSAERIHRSPKKNRDCLSPSKMQVLHKSIPLQDSVSNRSVIDSEVEHKQTQITTTQQDVTVTGSTEVNNDCGVSSTPTRKLSVSASPFRPLR